MNKVILQLGGNRGDMQENFSVAIAKIEEKIGKVKLKSNLYETEPWGYDDVKWFLNQVIEVETSMTAHDILKETQKIEKSLGREIKRNPDMYEGRPIDIDLLFFNSEVIHLDDLIIPHPFIRHRLFVLKPLCDHWKDLVHPEYGVAMEELLRRCDDIGLIRLYEGGELKYPGMDLIEK